MNESLGDLMPLPPSFLFLFLFLFQVVASGLREMKQYGSYPTLIPDIQATVQNGAGHPMDTLVTPPPPSRCSALFPTLLTKSRYLPRPLQRLSRHLSLSALSPPSLASPPRELDT